MPRYASGKFAKGVCMRSGKEVPYRDLVRDGHNRNLWVAPDWYEPEHPLENIVPVDDPIALHHPSPRRGHLNATVRFPLFDVATGKRGGQLFRLFDNAFDLDADAFNVALYTNKPGAAYSAAHETQGPGYAAGGMPVALSLDGQMVTIADTVWPSATFGALWLLAYEIVSGDGLMRVNLGSVQAADNGAFAIAWGSAKYVADPAGTQIEAVVV